MKGSEVLILGLVAAAVAAAGYAVSDPLARFVVGRLPAPSPKTKGETIEVVALPVEMRGFVKA